jgi:tellurite resistance protein TerC
MDVMNRFYFLKLGLAALLTFVGVKMLIHDIFKLSTNYSLMAIVSILAVSMVASFIRNRVIMIRQKSGNS